MLGVSDLAGAAAVALALVDDDEEIAAVLPCDPSGDGRLVYLCALRASDSDDLTGWLAIMDGEPVTETDTVRRAASIVALCETAEEAAGVPDADALLDAVQRSSAAAQRSSAQGAELPGLAAALAACEPPAGALARGALGVRVASNAYVDSIGRELVALEAAQMTLRPLAERISSSLSGEPGDPGEPLARAIWEVLGRIAAVGGPARLADQVGAATGAVEAFADDVVLGYRMPLEDEEQTT